MKKKILGWVLVAVFIAAIPLVYATVVKDSMTFEKLTSTGTFTAADIAATGTLTQVGNIAQDGALVQGWDTVGTATTATLAATSQDWILVNKTVGLASLTIALPTITSALDGKVFIFKQLDSGTTDASITPTAGVDAIESTRGTLTGVSDYVIDAIGDRKGWKAHYRSGASPVWLLIDNDVA